MEDSHGVGSVMRVLVVTVGTRGDVLPFVGIGQELVRRGHVVSIVTHSEFAGLVADVEGCQMVPLDGSPTALMPQFPAAFVQGDIPAEIAFVKELDVQMAGNRRKIWDAACAFGATIILSMMSYHLECVSIATRLGIPVVVCCTYPVYPTKERIPLAIGVREFPIPVARFFKWIGNQVSWNLMKDAINSWRVNDLLLDPLPDFSWDLVPQLNLYSSLIAPRPSDWPDYVYDASSCKPAFKEYDPPEDLAAFLRAGDAPIYLGFGSMFVLDAEQFALAFVAACEKLGRRGILCSRLSDTDADTTRSVLPETVLHIHGAPHDWLFPQCCAAVIHGGAGTTHAVLSAGIPCVIFPFLSSLLQDQLFWARQCSALRVGPKKVICFKDFSAETLLSQLTEVFDETSTSMLENARTLGNLLRQEQKGPPQACDILENLYEWMRPKEPLQLFWETSDCGTCGICESEYGMFYNRKRRCSACGLRACSACLQHRQRLMNYDREVYVCEACEKRLGNNGTSECMPLGKRS